MEWLLSALISFVLTSIFLLWLLRKLKSDLQVALEDFPTALGEKFQEFFSPVVKRGMSIAGKMGGDAKAISHIQNKVATGFLNQNYGTLKMLGEQVLGLDIDGLIEDYGAANVIKAFQGFQGLVKGNPSGLLGGVLGGARRHNSPNHVPEMK